MNKRIATLWKFLTYDIWRITEDEVTKTTFSLYNIIKTIYLCINRFTKDRLVNKASALTYSTLLAIVPILAIVFAIARGFGFDNLMESQIVQGFGGPSETTEVIFQFVNSYLSQTKNGIFIGVGLIMLLWTVLNLINNMEITFNRIWQVKKARSMYRKITDYFSMLLLIPLLLVVSGGLSIFSKKDFWLFTCFHYIFPPCIISAATMCFCPKHSFQIILTLNLRFSDRFCIHFSDYLGIGNYAFCTFYWNCWTRFPNFSVR